MTLTTPVIPVVRRRRRQPQSLILDSRRRRCSSRESRAPSRCPLLRSELPILRPQRHHHHRQRRQLCLHPHHYRRKDQHLSRRLRAPIQMVRTRVPPIASSAQASRNPVQALHSITASVREQTLAKTSLQQSLTRVESLECTNDRVLKRKRGPMLETDQQQQHHPIDRPQVYFFHHVF